MPAADYIATIGIECHVQLKTKTKLFAAVNADSRGAKPNTNVSPICFGLPGVLPVLNEQAVNLAILAGIALNAEIAHVSSFDRKNYFYPDLPKGYQITQFAQPIVGKGTVEVPLGDKTFNVGITRAHLEEDAGKLIHPDGKDYSLVDLNRAGTPLLEIVSEPDMHTPEEARAFARELYHLMRYASVSDVDLYHGNMRFDVNVSLAKPDQKELGTRSETKNLNSFKSVERAVAYEIKRQSELLDKGQVIVQETRGWDDVKQKTTSQRSKEEAHDYRYFPEPDLPPVVLDADRVEAAKQTMPKLPKEIRSELQAAGISKNTTEVLIDYPGLIQKIQTEQIAGAEGSHLKRIADWLVNVIIATFKESKNLDIDDASSYLQAGGQLLELSRIVEAGTISASAAKTILAESFTDWHDAKALVERSGLAQQSDSAELESIVQQVLADNPKPVADVKAGEAKAIGFLVGQVMAKTSGRANPQMVNQILRKMLEQ